MLFLSMSNQPGQVAQATANTAADCIFCKLVKGEIPAKKVYEDEKVIAVLDLYPATPGHVIIVPREHFMIMPQLPAGLSEHMALVAKKLSVLLMSSMQAKGVNIFVANGAPAGQKSPHFLMHVIPRYDNDGLNQNIPEKKIDEASLKKLYDQLVPILKNMGLSMDFGDSSGANIEKSPTPQGQPAPAPQGQPMASAAPAAQGVPQQQGPLSEEQVFKVLESNPQLREILINQPGAVKSAMPQNPQLQQIFNGHDIDALSKKLKSGGAPTPAQQPTANTQPPTPNAQQNVPEDQLIQLINSNSQLKEVMISQPDALKASIPQNPQLQQIFAGHDIDALRKKIMGGSDDQGGVDLDKVSNMFGSPTPQPANPKPPTANSQQPTSQAPVLSSSQQAPQPTPAPQSQQPANSQQLTANTQQNVPEDQVIQLINSNPQLKEVLVSQPDTLKASITQNPQLQQIFAGHDIDALRKKIMGGSDDQGGVDLDKVSNMFGSPTPQPANPKPPTANSQQPTSQAPTPQSPQQELKDIAETPTQEKKKNVNLDKISNLFGG